MDTIILIAAFSISIGIIFFVGFMSQKIFTRQEQLARKLEEMAGIQSINQFDEKATDVPERETSHKSLAQVVRINQPEKNLKILTLSGANSLLRTGILQDLLARGVDVDLMLLSPKSKSLFFELYPHLLHDIEKNLKFLKKIQTGKYQGNLSVRCFDQAVFQMLMFVDDDLLFLSSFVPASSAPKLVYEIKSGDKSLYNLYKPVFEFIWDQAQPIKG